MDIFIKRILNWWSILKIEGIYFFALGIIKYIYYRMIQRKYHFEKWHLIPCELRPYAMNIVRFLNGIDNIEEKVVCEIGCGIGEIIRNVNAGEKFGLDIALSAIGAARFLSLKIGDKTQYYHGSFDDIFLIRDLEKIDILITVNFVHTIPFNMLRELYLSLLLKIQIKYIIIDQKKNLGLKYKHDIYSLFQNIGDEIKCIDSYPGENVYLVKVRERIDGGKMVPNNPLI